MVLLTMVSATMHTVLGLFALCVLINVIVIPNYPCKAKVASGSGLVLGDNLLRCRIGANNAKHHLA